MREKRHGSAHSPSSAIAYAVLGAAVMLLAVAGSADAAETHPAGSAPTCGEAVVEAAAPKERAATRAAFFLHGFEAARDGRLAETRISERWLAATAMGLADICTAMPAAPLATAYHRLAAMLPDPAPRLPQSEAALDIGAVTCGDLLDTELRDETLSWLYGVEAALSGAPSLGEPLKRTVQAKLKDGCGWAVGRPVLKAFERGEA